MLGVGGFRRGRKAVEFLSVSCVRDPYKNSDCKFLRVTTTTLDGRFCPSLASSSVRVSVSHSPPAPPPRARDVSYDVSLLFQQRTYPPGRPPRIASTSAFPPRYFRFA